MPTFVRVASYEGALAAPDADVAVFSPAGELGRAALEGLGDELVGLACSARPFAVRVVIDLGAVGHLDYRGLRPLAARKRLLASCGGGLWFAAPTVYVGAILAAGPWQAWIPVAPSIEEAVRALTAAS